MFLLANFRLATATLIIMVKLNANLISGHWVFESPCFKRGTDSQRSPVAVKTSWLLVGYAVSQFYYILFWVNWIPMNHYIITNCSVQTITESLQNILINMLIILSITLIIGYCNFQKSSTHVSSRLNLCRLLQTLFSQ